MILLFISLSLWLKNITLYGMSVNPHTRYAFWSWGLPTTCANTGSEKDSVIFNSLVALSETFVTAN